MHAIQYEAPTTLEQAVSLMAQAGERARAFCGGTDIIVQMRAGTRRPELLVDVKRVPELTSLSFDPKQGLRLGAAVSCIEIHENPVMCANYPGLTEAAHLIGSLQIQNRASVGGNLCNGSPAADTTPALIALGAVARIAGPKGQREVPVEQFCLAPGRTVLQPDELLVELLIASPKAKSSDAYLRFIPRNEMDIAVVGAGAAITIEGNRCVAAGIGLGAVGPTAISAQKVAQALVGKEIDQAVLTKAAQLASELSTPIDDMRGTAEFRRHVVGVLTRRAIERAAERARNR